MKHQDPKTGKFAKGNPGRQVGTVNKKTLQWHEIGELITGNHTTRFNDLLSKMWDSPDPAEQMKAAELYLKFLEYHKPKLQRTQVESENKSHFPLPTMILVKTITGTDGREYEIEQVQGMDNRATGGPVVYLHREVIGEKASKGMIEHQHTVEL